MTAVHGRTLAERTVDLPLIADLVARQTPPGV